MPQDAHMIYWWLYIVSQDFKILNSLLKSFWMPLPTWHKHTMNLQQNIHTQTNIGIFYCLCSTTFPHGRFQSSQVSWAGNMCSGAAMSQPSFCNQKWYTIVSPGNASAFWNRQCFSKVVGEWVITSCGLCWTHDSDPLTVHAELTGFCYYLISCFS